MNTTQERTMLLIFILCATNFVAGDETNLTPAKFNRAVRSLARRFVSVPSCNCGECGFFDCCACNGPCFPASARLSLENGNSKEMNQLNIGDKVLTVSSDGKEMYSQIRTIVKSDPVSITKYKLITTSCNKTISLSGNHLIYVRKDPDDKFNAIYANKVSVDDQVLIQENDKMIPAKVVNVSSSILTGLYVPLTMEGNIVVDGVLASCYPSVPHDLAHMGTTPIPLFPSIFEWIFGNDNGFSVFVKVAENTGRIMLPYGQQNF